MSPSDARRNTALEQLCAELACSPEVQAGSSSLLECLDSNEDQLGSQPAEPSAGQLAAALYISSLRLKQTVSVTQLVIESRVNFKDFLFNVEEFAGRLPAGDGPDGFTQLKPIIEQQVKDLKAQFLVGTIAFSKYKKFYPVFFKDGFVGKQDDESFNVGWLLFVFAKWSVLGTRGDLTSVYHLLASVLHFLLGHLPQEAQTSGDFWAELEQEVPAETYPLPEHAKTLFCSLLEPKALADEMIKIEPNMHMFTDKLRELLNLEQPTAVADGGGGGEGLLGLLRPETLQDTYDALSERYAEIWPEKSQLDETFFLKQLLAPPARVAPPSVPSSPCRPSTAAGIAGSSEPQQLLTPLRNSGSSPAARPMPKGTPISSHLESVSWLRDAVLLLDVQPNTELQRYFSLCQPDPGVAIRERLERLCSQILESPQLQAEERPEEVEERCVLARRLYFKMLLSILTAEEKRLRQTNFTSLLSQDTFHRSLFACCTEAVFASYHMSSMAFPTVLDLLGVKAFDFCKVIESFVRYEPTLPNQLKRHFADVDSTILESLAWSDDSPLPTLMAEHDRANGVTEGNPSGQNRAKVALEQFLRKVLHLAANRIQDLCCRLLLPSALVKQVWECLKLVVHQSRHLLLGRHLDQIIMCTIYGVCKVNQRQVTFRHIIEQYKRQAKATPKVFREVRMKTASEPPQDIICFYNHIFIPAMKDQLMKVCCALPAPPSAAPSTATASPRINEARSTSSPQQVSAQREVYISQPRTPSGTAMTPRTRTLYCIGDTPREQTASALQQINHAVNNPHENGAAMLEHLSRSTPASYTAAPTGQSGSKRPLESATEGRGMSKGQLRRRLMENDPGRSSSQGSNSSGDGAPVEE